jgi:hypothetical protein
MAIWILNYFSSKSGEISPKTLQKNKKKTGEKTQNGYRVRALKFTT